MTTQENVLSVKDLCVKFHTPDGAVQAVNHLSFDIAKGHTFGIVGESGSGKSQSVLSLMGLLADNGEVSGSALFQGKEILNLPVSKLNSIRGNKIAMIFQDPMTSLNPYMKVGKQMTEVLREHRGMNEKDAVARAITMLDAVHIPSAKRRINMYPHEFSGGMRQRVMIAMALLCEPDLLIADEPTTALDVTVQAQILDLMKELKTDFNTAIILITHDLGVVAGVCDSVLVMYGGRMVEYGSVDDIFYRQAHPYTQGLIQSVPRLDEREATALATIAGSPPSLRSLPSGCAFHPRCKYAFDQCKQEVPQSRDIGDGRQKACHLEQLL